MPNLAQAKVCVIALTYADLKTDPALQAKLTSFFTTPGKPYHSASPDEWCPFDADPVRQYLANANIQASFLSTQLDNAGTRSKALKNTSLCIIDVLVLLHAVKGPLLAGEIQSAIYQGNKDFCIILPETVLDPLRAGIVSSFKQELSDLWDSWMEQDEYNLIESHFRFKQYLSRLAHALQEKPDQGSLTSTQQIYLASGVPAPSLTEVPRIGKRV